jgi:hypothetical protein
METDCYDLLLDRDAVLFRVYGKSGETLNDWRGDRCGHTWSASAQRTERSFYIPSTAGLDIPVP